MPDAPPVSPTPRASPGSFLNMAAPKRPYENKDGFLCVPGDWVKKYYPNEAAKVSRDAGNVGNAGALFVVAKRARSTRQRARSAASSWNTTALTCPFQAEALLKLMKYGAAPYSLAMPVDDYNRRLVSGHTGVLCLLKCRATAYGFLLGQEAPVQVTQLQSSSYEGSL